MVQAKQPVSRMRTFHFFFSAVGSFLPSVLLRGAIPSSLRSQPPTTCPADNQAAQNGSDHLALWFAFGACLHSWELLRCPGNHRFAGLLAVSFRSTSEGPQ